MQLALLAFLASGAIAATLHDLSDRTPVPPGDRVPLSLAQMSEVMNAESAALPETQLNLKQMPFAPPPKQEDTEAEKVAAAIAKEEAFNNGPIGKVMNGVKWAVAQQMHKRKEEWEKSMPKPADPPPTFETEQDKKIWEAEQGVRIKQGDNAFGDLENALTGLQKMNDRAQARIIKKFALNEKKADITKQEPTALVEEKADVTKQEPTQKEKEKEANREAEALGESVVEPKPARRAETKASEGAGGWDVTFYVLLTACVFVFGWWAIKVGLHQRAAEAASEFAFQCKKALSTLLKGGDGHTKMQEEKSESSYDASTGSEGSASSKGALNSHLQGVIDRVKTNLGDEEKGTGK